MNPALWVLQLPVGEVDHLCPRVTHALVSLFHGYSGEPALKSGAHIADRTRMDLTAIALQGLDQAGTQLESAASTIASFQSSSPAGANLDTVDLSAAVVALQSAKNLYSANLATVKAADEIFKPQSI